MTPEQSQANWDMALQLGQGMMTATLIIGFLLALTLGLQTVKVLRG